MTSDRFHFTPVENLPFPGSCAICGSSRRPCIDFRIDIDYFGTLLVCTECIIESVHVPELDLMRRSDAVRLMEENDIMKRQLAMAVDAMEDLQSGLVAAVDTYVHRVRNLVTEPVVDTLVPTEEHPEHVGTNIVVETLGGPPVG
jgi:hypothetical protein